MRDAVAVEQRKVVVQGWGGRRRVATVGIERRIRRPGMGVAIDDHGTSPDSGGRHKDNSARSEEHTSELQSLMRISYAVFCLKKTNNTNAKHDQPVSLNCALHYIILDNVY